MTAQERKICMTGHRAGFSLVELLVVMAMMGIIASAIFALYLNTQRSALEQEQVVDVQQTIRFAMDQIGRDIRMAGFLVPGTTTAISGAPNLPDAATPLTVQTATSADRVLRVATRFLSPSTVDAVQEVTVDSSEMAVLFKAGDLARIIRPDRRVQPLDAILEFTESPAGAAVKLKGFNASTQFEVGDMIVLTTAAAPNPNTIAYSLEDGEIRRAINGGAKQTLATGIGSFELGYLMDDGSELTAVPALALNQIRGVRVAISGQADTQEGMKTRSVTSVVSLRNKVD